jgi:excisionase family DNA binding protein
MTSSTPPRRCCSAQACRSSSSRRCFGTGTPKLTEAVYGHLATDYLRSEVNRLKLQGMPEPPNLRARAGRRVSPVSPTPQKTPKGPELLSRFLSDSDPFSVSGRQDSNLRPLGPEGSSGISTKSMGIQPVAFVQGSEASHDAPTPIGCSGTLGHVPPVAPNLARCTRRLSAVDAPLLSVREAANHLRVSTATVYGLCERGELRHVRVSNAIRLRVEDIEDFIRRAAR